MAKIRHEEKIDVASMILNSWDNGKLINTKDIRKNNFPNSRLEGYRIQDNLRKLSSKKIFGWKIAASNVAGQKHIGVKSPLAGILFEDKKFNFSEKIPLLPNNMNVAEIEFIFKINKDLDLGKSGYTDNETLSIIEGLYSGIELPASRFKDFLNAGEALLIADNACANQFILGPKLSDSWKNKNLADQDVFIEVNNKYKASGSGKHVLGNPLKALKWLLNEFIKYKIQLKKGHFVASGTCTKPIAFKKGDILEANYGDLGNFNITI